MTVDLNRLVTDIKAGKCALVLGPEIFAVGDLPLQSYVRQQLMNRFGDQIVTYHERDGFFLLQTPDDKPDLQYELQHIYRSIKPAETLLQQILEVPFSLVLSVNPDTWLRDLSYANGLPCRFGWFDARKQEELLLPDSDGDDPAALRERTPLYYNLCGCIERQSTLVLDYDDLFRLLEGLLGAPKLPEKLSARLKDTTSYLFLGFQFERWHTQLLLRLLDVRNSGLRFAMHSPEPKEKDTKAFVLKHFRINFLGDDALLMDKLHEAFAQEGLLRPANSAGTPAGKAIAVHLQKGELDKAVARLLNAATAEVRDDATLLSGQYHQYTEQKDKGLVDSRDLYTMYNKICDGVLRLSKKV